MTQPSPTTRREICLGDLFAAVRARWGLVAFVTLAAAAAGVGFVLGQGDAYLATAHLAPPVSADPVQGWQAVQACVDRLEGPAFSVRLAKKLDMAQVRGFRAAHWGVWATLWDRARGALLGAAAAPPSDHDISESLRARIVARAAADPQSLDVGVLAASPDDAVRLANAVADELVRGLPAPWPSRPLAPRGPDTHALAARRAPLQAQVDLLKRFLGTPPESRDIHVPFVPGNQALERLRVDLVEVAEHLQALGRKLGAKHPDLVAARERRRLLVGLARREAAHLVEAAQKEAEAIDRGHNAPQAGRASLGPGNVPTAWPAPLRVVRRAVHPEHAYRVGRVRTVAIWSLCGLGAALLLVIARNRERLDPHRVTVGGRRELRPVSPPTLTRKA